MGFACVAATTSACSLILGIGETDFRFEPGTEDGGRTVVVALEDGGASDATALADGTSVTEDSASRQDASLDVNLLPEGDFESGCKSWQVIGGTVEPSVIGRNGTKGCLFCASATIAAPLQWAVDAAVPSGSEFVGQIWVRLGFGATPDVVTQLRISFRPIDPLEKGAGVPENGPPLSNDWQRITASVVAKVPGDQLSSTFTLSNGCVLLDDASLVRTK